jgi:FKBP-type peptidyl-prolyl cis-trans isomerase
MKIGLNTLLAVSLGLTLLPAAARAEDKATFKDEKEKASYAVGTFFGNQIKRSNMELDVDQIMLALKDVAAGRELKLNEQQAREAINTYQTETRKKLAEKNKKDGEAFLAENKKKDGVKIKEVTLPTGTKAELQYKVIKEGTGVTPKSNDVATVIYRGTLINGKEFDSSGKAAPGQTNAPTRKFPVNRVVRGWTEALESMPVGSKWQIFLPSTLAYGDTGSGPTIEPGSALIFEVELVAVEAAPPPVSPQQPLTSDIIKVPSADELKKGAKIEVIKPEDAAKMAEAEAAKKAQGNAPKTDKK